MATEAKHLHYIEHVHEAGYGIQVKFTCKGDRSSPCHQYPPAELEMEVWGEQERHLFVAHDECLWETWGNLECAKVCGPDGEPVRGGPEPVSVWFDECMVWEYAHVRDAQTRAADEARSDAAWELYKDRQGGA